MKDRLAPDLLDRSKQGFSIPLAERRAGDCATMRRTSSWTPTPSVADSCPPALRRLWDLHQTRWSDYGPTLEPVDAGTLGDRISRTISREAPSGAATAAQPLFSPNTAVRRPVEAGMTQGLQVTSSRGQSLGTPAVISIEARSRRQSWPGFGSRRIVKPPPLQGGGSILRASTGQANGPIHPISFLESITAERHGEHRKFLTVAHLETRAHAHRPTAG